jgi:hypothetical protein
MLVEECLLQCAEKQEEHLTGYHKVFIDELLLS